MSKNHYIIPIFVPHKGCPHDCIFCNQKKITGHEREASAAEVGETIERYLETIPGKDNVVEVAFYGGSFTAIPMETQTELLGIAYKFMRQERIQNIRLSTRPDYINHRILENLKRFGVTTVELGVQSMDEEVLELSQRGHSSIDVIRSVELLKQYEFIVGVQLMVGLPGDSYEKCMDSVRALVNLKPDIARLYPALVIRNTYMEQLYLEGRYVPLTVDEAAERCKAMLMLFEKNGVEVIRIGLQPTDNIELGRDVVAGPFHPSMRQLAESLIYRDMAEYLLKRLEYIAAVTFTVNPGNISTFLGQKKSNLEYIQKSFKNIKVTIKQDKTIDKETILVNNGINETYLSKKDYYYITSI